MAFKKRSIKPKQVQDHFGNRDDNFAGLARALPCPALMGKVSHTLLKVWG